MTSEQSSSRYMQSLEPAAIERIGELLHEITDMSIALGRLFESEAEHHDCCYAAFRELCRGMDTRLVKCSNFVDAGKEEG